VGGVGKDPGLAGTGRGVEDGDAVAVGQRRERGGGLVFAQPGARARAVRGVRASG
jgi:hypothetical protein